MSTWLSATYIHCFLSLTCDLYVVVWHPSGVSNCLLSMIPCASGLLTILCVSHLDVLMKISLQIHSPVSCKSIHPCLPDLKTLQATPQVLISVLLPSYDLDDNRWCYQKQAPMLPQGRNFLSVPFKTNEQIEDTNSSTLHTWGYP